MSIVRTFAMAVALTAAAPAFAQMTTPPAPAEVMAPAQPAATAADAAYGQPGPHQVAAITGVWRDEGRRRDVAYLMRYPADLAAPAPVVIFSHGLGGSERGAVYYSEHLASHGFIVVHLRHQGSDTAVWGGVRPTPGAVDLAALRRAVADPRVTIDRFRDVPFALLALDAFNRADTPLKGKLDLRRVGMSGHSFGAVSTQAAAGQLYPRGLSFPARGVKAFLAMSPSGARSGDNAAAFEQVRDPFMFLTGTEDTFGIGEQTPEEVLASRRAPFDAIAKAPTYFVNLVGADHLTFSGRQEMGESRPDDVRDHQIVCAAALAFFRAYLEGDASAKAWLDEGGLARYVGADALVERKAGR